MIFIGAYLELKWKPEDPERIFEGPFPDGVLGFSVIRWWPNRPINRDRAGVDVAFMMDGTVETATALLQLIPEIHSYDIVSVGSGPESADAAKEFTLFCDWLKGTTSALEEVS